MRRESTSYDERVKGYNTGEGFKMEAASVKDNTLEDLKDAAFVTLSPALVKVDDEKWQKLIPFAIRLPGGCELVIDNEKLSELISKKEEGLEDSTEIALIANDPYIPKIGVKVLLGSLNRQYNRIEKGTGPRTNTKRVRCIHKEDFLPRKECWYCFWRWCNKHLDKLDES